MLSQELPLDAMAPRISLCRLYDTTQAERRTPRYRTAEYYELGFYLGGSGSVTADGHTYPIAPGDIRFTRPGSVLCSQPDYQCYTVYFDLGGHQVLYHNPLLDGLPAYFRTNGEHLAKFQQLLDLYLAIDLCTPVRCSAALLNLLASLFESIYAPESCCKAVRLCTEHIRSHFSGPITLDTLSAVSGYSKPHILRLFQQDLGCSPHEYLTSVRISHAKQLLTDTALTLPAIASECGFSSDSHFKTLFLNLTGLTPGNYRKNTKL